MIKKVVKKISPRAYSQAKSLRDEVTDIRRVLHRVETKLNQADTRMDHLKAIYAKADPYQPLYGIAEVGKPQRETRDRCEAIYEYYDNNVNKLRALDIGCFFGYLSFYLADRGAIVESWDNNSVNIEVCNAVKGINGIPVDFRLKEFAPEAIASINPGQYDVAFMLSVAHWLVALHGLEYVQDCMKLLLDKVPFLIVELAQKGENKDLFWDKAVPKNGLDIFAKVKGLKVTKLGDFPTHLSGKRRPLYAISKDHVTVNNHQYEVLDYKTRAYKKAPLWRPVATTYFEGPTVFIKQYNYEDALDETKRSMFNEVNFFLQNASIHVKKPLAGVAMLKDFEINSGRASLVFERIHGGLLEEVTVDGKTRTQKIVRNLLRVLVDLEKRGLHHNDVRSWNIMVDNNDKVYLIDFEFISTLAYENNIIAFFWAVNTLLTGVRESTDRNKEQLPTRENFVNYKALLSIYDLYKVKSKINFDVLLQHLESNAKGDYTSSKKSLATNHV